MIGMNFPAFLTLLALGVISAAIWHTLIRYRVLDGFDGFLGKWIAGWIGGWLGSPVFGHWSISVAGLYFVPAVIGAFLGPFLVTATFRAMAMRVAEAQRRNATASQAGASPQYDLRKAS